MSNFVTVADMIRADLDREGADGLFNPILPCGCSRNDLAPCGSIEMSCVRAYLVKPTQEEMDEWGITENDEWYAPKKRPQEGGTE